MSIKDRAAQFAPFSALDGHDDAIKETARLTDYRPEIDDYKKEELNQKLMYIWQVIEERPNVLITYFTPDEKKQGGAVINFSGAVKRILDHEGIVVMMDNTTIPINDILSIEGEIFEQIDD